MRIVIQRVSRASVTVDGETVGKIGKGFLLLIGAADTDTEEIVDKMIAKVGKLRIFEDENGKTNLSLKDVGGEILAVSQFTLYADCRKLAERLYEYAAEKCREYSDTVEKGIFGADMKVELVNDGPFTIVLDSDTMISG